MSRRRQQIYRYQPRGFLDFVGKRRTNKRSSYIIPDQQSIAHRFSINSAKFINK